MITVLSLFDGISAAALALKRLGVRFVLYASEIDAEAISVSRRHFPQIVQVGDVRSLKGRDFPSIDLLIGGFPCPDYSRLGSGKGLKGKTGNLFFEFERMYRECRPGWVVAENVVMPNKHRDTITDWFRLDRHLLDGQWFGPQRRGRIIWTDIKVPPVGNLSSATLGDIVERGVEGYDARDLRPEFADTYDLVPDGEKWRSLPVEHPSRVHIEQIIQEQKARGCSGGMSRWWEVSALSQKSPALLASGPGSYGPPQNLTRFVFRDPATAKVRFPTPLEYERLMGFPDGYTDGFGLSDESRYRLLGNSFEVNTFCHVLSPFKPSEH